jgi:transposase InsO family protein
LPLILSLLYRFITGWKKFLYSLNSRVKTPKDNREIEKFNGTLEYEWLYNFNLCLDPEELNPRLTNWLIEYNFNRPHQSLAYLLW